MVNILMDPIAICIILSKVLYKLVSCLPVPLSYGDDYTNEKILQFFKSERSSMQCPTQKSMYMYMPYSRLQENCSFIGWVHNTT